MNNTDLLTLIQERNNILKKYHLDEEGIKTYQETLKEKGKEVSAEESERLGKELYDCIKSLGYIGYNTLSPDPNDKAISADKYYDKVIELIYNGANIEYRTPTKGDTPLLLCARRNFVQTFALLVKFGADINRGNNYQTTPVMTSARHGNKKILELLILLGADINAKCLDGENAIMSAKRHDQKECFELLKKANAHFGARNILNKTIKDIPSTEEFDFSGILTLGDSLIEEISYAKTQELLEEAEKKFSEITLGLEPEEQQEQRVKKREFKRVQ